MISIIVITFNSESSIESCLDAVFNQKYHDCEIIVVDNGSSDSTCEFIKKAYPDVILIGNGINMGSSFARNQGLKLAQGEYIMFMDSDTCIERNFFQKLESVLRSLPVYIGGVSPKILKANTDKIFSCGLSISSIYRTHDIGADKASSSFTESFNVGGLNSCCAVFKRDSLERAKERGQYFDESFFFLFEDADLSLRVKQKGYKFLFCPELLCYHSMNGSNTPKNFRRFLCFRNRIFMALKIKGKMSMYKFFIRSFPYDFVRTVHFALTNKYFIKALKDIANKALLHNSTST